MSKYTLKDIVFLVFRYKFGVLLFSLYLATGLSLYLVCAKKLYESHAEVLVRFGQEQLGSPTLGSMARSVYISRREEEIQNEIRILTSTDTLSATAAAFAGPKAEARDVLQIRAYLANRLTVSALKNSDTIEVSFLFPEPHVAQKALGLLLEQYQKHHGQVYFDANEQRVLQSKLDSARADYGKALDELAEFERLNNVFDDRQLVVLNETREQQQLNLNALTNEYAYTFSKRNRLQDVLKDLPPEILYSSREVINEKHAKLSERLAQAYVDRENQMRRYKADSRPVKDIDDEIRLLKDLLRKEPQRLVNDKENRRNEIWESLNRQVLELTPEVEAQQARIDSLRTQVGEIDEALARAAAVKGQHALLVRDVELKKTVYDRYHTEVSEVLGRKNAMQQSITNVAIIESPSFSPLPAKPNSKRIIFLGLVLLGVGNAFILGSSMFFDKTLSLPSQAGSTLGLPVMGVFNEEPSTRGRTGGTGTPFYEVHSREMRSLYLKATSRAVGSLLFTLAEKDSTVQGFARDFALFALNYQQRKPAIVRYANLFDRDGKAASAGKAFSFSGASGGTLSGNDTAASPKLAQGLALYERSSLNMEEERAFWDLLKEQHDLLVFDYGAVQESNLLVALADYVDCTLFVIEAERSNKYVAKHALDSLRQIGLENIGLVLAERRLHIPQGIYKYL